jgi:BlaI family penicillinase repressor
MGMTSKASNPLTRREREIMDVLLEMGEDASAEDIRSRLPNPPSYSAVRAMLAKLEAKGIIRHKEQGLRYVYSPTAPRSAARRSALQRLIRVFFGGSSGEAVTALLESEDWSAADLDEMTRRIERIRKERAR